jgi:hypothetical protein
MSRMQLEQQVEFKAFRDAQTFGFQTQNRIAEETLQVAQHTLEEAKYAGHMTDLLASKVDDLKVEQDKIARQQQADALALRKQQEDAAAELQRTIASTMTESLRVFGVRFSVTFFKSNSSRFSGVGFIPYTENINSADRRLLV